MQSQEHVDINSVVKDLTFVPTTKKPTPYKYVEVDSLDQMPPMSYTKSLSQQQVVTVPQDGPETTNTAQPGDVVISGPSQEKYVIKDEDFNELYQGGMGGTVVPVEEPRQVAQYQGNQEVTFTAPWGKSMVLKPGDYLVKDPVKTGYYRIARQEFEATYQVP